MDKRQLLLNALFAVALSALHRIIEESALLAMRFTAGKLAERSRLFEPYMPRNTHFRYGQPANNAGSKPANSQQRQAPGEVVVHSQADPRRKRDPYAHVYEYDPFDDRHYG